MAAFNSTIYFVGFPADQPTYTITSGASSSNLLSLSAVGYQMLTFPTTSATLTIVCPNTYPIQSCNVTVSVMMGTATSFILSVTKSGITYASALYEQNLSNTQWTNITLSFNSPIGTTSSLNINIGG